MTKIYAIIVSVIGLFALAFSPVLANDNCNGNCCPMEQKTQAIDEAQQQQAPALGDALNQVGATDFATILQKTGADKMLAQGGPYTIFAPTNDALNKLPSGVIDKMKNDPNLFKETIENHIMQGSLSKENETSPDLKTALGNKIEVTKNGQDVFINGQKVTSAIQYSNGVIYVIDGTILPPSVF